MSTPVFCSAISSSVWTIFHLCSWLNRVSCAPTHSQGQHQWLSHSVGILGQQEMQLHLPGRRTDSSKCTSVLFMIFLDCSGVIPLLSRGFREASINLSIFSGPLQTVFNFSQLHLQIVLKAALQNHTCTLIQGWILTLQLTTDKILSPLLSVWHLWCFSVRWLTLLDHVCLTKLLQNAVLLWYLLHVLFHKKFSLELN